MSDLQILDESPFAAFVMSEFHEPEVARIVAHEEAGATAALGFVACPGDHADCAPDADGWHAFTCVECGAAL